MDPYQARQVGKRIAETRKAAGMTQPQLADLLNLSARSVQDFEHGITVPWRYFERLEDIFGKSLSWFLRGEGDPTPPPDPDLAGRRHDELMARLEELRESQRVLMSRLDQLERSPRE